MKTKSQSINRIYQTVLATVLVCTVAPDAFATTMNSAYFDIYTSSPAISASESKGAAPASVTSGSTAASADFGVLKAKAQSAATASEFGNSTYSGASTAFQVSVGSAPSAGGTGSGVVFDPGVAVDLSMSFRVDGTLHASSSATAGSLSASSLGSAGTTAKLRIVDPSILLDCGSSDGCYTPRLLDFSMRAYAESYDLGVGYTAENYNNWYWGVNTKDGLGVSTGSQSNSSSGTAAFLSFDTGILTATISTYIGAILDINGDIGLLAQSYLGASAGIDFYNTMGLVFTPPKDVVLGYGAVGLAPYDLGGSVIPLPGTLPLFLSGLVGLGFLGRWRRKA